jgi:hypothetical protein
MLARPDDHAPLDSCAREHLRQLKVLCSQFVGVGARAMAVRAQQTEGQHVQLAANKRALDERVESYVQRASGGTP